MIQIMLTKDSWAKSKYCGQECLIVLGTNGTMFEISTTLAHEIGHAILRHNEAIAGTDIIESEVVAWEWVKSRLKRKGFWTTTARNFAILALSSYGINVQAF